MYKFPDKISRLPLLMRGTASKIDAMFSSPAGSLKNTYKYIMYDHTYVCIQYEILIND